MKGYEGGGALNCVLHTSPEDVSYHPKQMVAAWQLPVVEYGGPDERQAGVSFADENRRESLAREP